MKKRKKVAVFDIDGTIFRSSFLIELTDALIRDGIFPVSIERIYTKAAEKWLDRQGTYEKYIEAVVKAFELNIKGVAHKKFLKIAREVVAVQKNRTYRYTHGLVKDLKRKNYYMLAISNSPKEIVQSFAKSMGFDKVYGRAYEIDRSGKFTGKTSHENLISDKAKVLKRVILKEHLTLRTSVGVGDTESDIPFLKMVEKPICFNPNAKLYKYAKRAGWTIRVERKDIVYKF